MFDGSPRSTHTFLSGGGALGDLIGTFDWQRTPLGAIAQWPAHMRTATALMLRSAVPMVALWGERGVMIYNDAYAVFAGRRHPALLGSNVREGWAEVADFNDHVMQVGLAGHTLSYTDQELALDRDGRSEAVWMNLDYSPLIDGEGLPAGVLAIVVETTGKVRAEHALRETEARLRALNTDLESQVAQRSHERSAFWQLTSDLLGVLNGEGIFEKSNPAWQHVLGWQEDEIRITPIFDFLHPDDREATLHGFQRLTEGAPAVSVVTRVRCKDQSYRWIAWTGAPEEGKYYCSGRDVTVEKEAQAQLNAAQDTLRQAQKMEAVGQLTGGIAHDFNNLLAAISSSLQVLDLRLKRGLVEGSERYITLGQNSVRRAASLTQRLLAFSRRQTLDPKPTDVNRLVAGMEELVRRTVGPAVVVEVIGAGGLWATRIDPSQLENAMLNLCINARDAMPEGGRLTIATANQWLDEQAAKERDVPPGEYLALCVTDTGTGMTAEVASRVFDPFFTTKPMGQGTGLGLSMVYGFVRQSGGQVRIDSEPGQGTTMCLYLPRHVAGLEEAEPVAPAMALAGGDGATVIVIEDESAIRELVVEMLEQAGYVVFGVGSGPAGLRLLQSARRVDLIITDVGLPGGMNGRQVADAARVQRPGLQVLFITGYAENAAVGNGLLEAGMAVITKPFAMDALLTKVGAMVAESRR